MSYRFSSFIMNNNRPKGSKSEAGGAAKAKSSTGSTYSNLSSTRGLMANNLSTSRGLVANNLSSSRGVVASTSKGRQPSPGPPPRTPTKTLLKSSVTSTKKSSCTVNRSRVLSPGVHSSTSDDMSKALVLKKKNPTRLPTVLKKNNAKAIKQDNDHSENMEKNSSIQKASSSKGIMDENPPLMHNEGPIEIPTDDFDFYSILSRPKVWNMEEDEEDTQIGSDSGSEVLSLPTTPPDDEEPKFDAVVHSSQAFNVVKKESEIWGEMRTSIADEHSRPPSLTSMGEDERKGNIVDKFKKQVEEGSAIRDENNNVLNSIKNSIYRSLTFFEISQPSTTISTTTTVSTEEKIDGNEEQKETVLVYGEEGNGHDSLSLISEQGPINDSPLGGESNEQQLSLKSNVSNSPPHSGICLRDSSHDSILIPPEIKEQLSNSISGISNNSGSVEFLQEYCSRQLKDYDDSETQLEKENLMNAEEPLSPEEEPPPLSMSQNLLLLEEEMKQWVSFPTALQEFIKVETPIEPELENQFDNLPSQINAISTISSYTSAVSEEEFCNADETVENLEVYDTQETQTPSVHAHDVETVTDNREIEDKQEKLKSLVMAVNTGVDITPPEKKKSKNRQKTMKAWRPESINIDGIPSSPTPRKRSLSQLTDQRIRRHPIPGKIKYPKTFTQVGADYGFPAHLSISQIIGNIATTMSWRSTDKEDDKTDKAERSETDNTPTFFDGGDGSRIVETAYEILNAGINFACNLIRVESELEPREDLVRYNGYKIRVCGKKLLLESVHTNCDFSVDANGIWYRSNHSYISLRPPSESRSELEQSCEGRRVRVVVRIAAPPILESDDAGPVTGLEHNVRHSDGQWTCTFGNGESGDNFIEIGCPTGVHPESLAYGIINGRILVDAP